MEVSALPIHHIMATRRIIYLKTLLHRSDAELTKQVYNAQKLNPTKGDYYNLILEDFANIGEDLNEKEIIDISDNMFKKYIKKKIQTHAFNELRIIQQRHEKVKDIMYKGLSEPQPYLISNKFDNKMRSLLFNLRCRTVSAIKDNFPGLYNQSPVTCVVKLIDKSTLWNALS